MEFGVIYKIENKINGKVYIGQTVRTFKERYSGDVSKYSHNNHVKRSMKKYGVENFNIIENFAIASSQEELDNLEKELILQFKSFDPRFGYNKDFGGKGGVPTEETKEKMKASQSKYKTPVVQLDSEFNFINRFDGAIDAVGFDKAVITSATKSKTTVKGYYFLTEEDYLNAINNEENLLKLRGELAGKKFANIIKIDEDFNIIKDTLDLKNEGYNCTELKKRAKDENVEFGENFFYTTLDKFLSGEAKPNYGKTFFAINKEGKIVSEYSKVSDVVSDGLDKSRVSACLNGKRKTYNECIWVYKNNYMELKGNKNEY